MDSFLKLTVLLLISGNVFAIPSKPSMQVTRAGATTTYKVLSTGGAYNPPASAPTGNGIQPLDATFSAQSNKYVTNLGVQVGEEIAAVKVANTISAANLAAAAVAMIPKLTVLGVAISVGSALYQYYQSSGLKADSTGISSDPLPIENPPSGNCGSYATPDLYCQHYYPYPNTFAASFTITNSGTQLNFRCSSGGTLYGNSLCSTASGYLNSCQSPNTWGSTYSKCIDPNSNGTRTPVTPTEAITKLTATPPADYSPVVKQIHDADPTGSTDPLADVPYLDSVPTGTTSTAPRQTVTPTGQVRTDTDTTTIAKPAADTMTATTTTTTVTVNNDNTTSTVTTNNAPPIPETKAETPKTDCEKYPDNIGCAKFGTPSTPEILPTTLVTMDLNPSSLGSGSCPSPQVLDMHGQPDITLSYQPYCDFATSVSPLVIAFAWLSAGLLVLGSIRES